MIEVSPKKPGSYRVKPHFSLSPRDTRRVHKDLLAFGAQERLGELTMDAWLLWNYRKLVEQSQEMPVEVETALHERRQWIACSEYLKEFLTEEQWNDCCFFHLNQQWNHLDYSDVGTGKAQPLTEPVMTPSGWRLIGELRVGDEVISGRTGKPCKVTGVFPQGKKPVYKVTAWDGGSALACSEHLWEVKDRAHRNVVKVVTTEFMSKHLKRDASTHNLRWTLPENPLCEYPKAELPVEPYVLGVLLGDGHCRKSSVAFTKGDPELAELVKEVLDPAFTLYEQLCENRTTSWYIRRKDVKDRSLVGAGYHTSLNEMGLCVGALKKFIPEKYLYSSFEQRLELLRGLLDTDGSASETSIEYATSSPQLAADFCELVRGLGGFVRCTERMTLSGNPGWRCYPRFPEGFPPVFKRKQQLDRVKARTKYKNFRRTVESVDYVGEEDCVCISVSCPSELYITRDGIVTHNTRTSIATAMIESPDAPMLILTLKACKYQWRDELLKLGYKGPIEILEGRNFKIPAKGVVITNYENLPPLSVEGKDQAPLENFLLALPKHFYLVVDEANKIQNSKANVTKRFRKLSEYVEKRGGKMIATTATPVENREAELWGMATSLRMQRKMFGNYDNFLRLFGGKMINRYGRMMVEWNPDDRIPEEIQERMSTCSRRRKRSQNRERYYEDVLVDISTNLDRFNIEGKSDEEILQMALTFENMGKIRNALAKEKLKASMELIEALEEQGPLLVTGCTVEVIQALGKRKGWEYIEGQVSAAKRNQIKNDFNSGKLKGVAFTVGAGGTGMNFPHAENMVVLDLHYNEGKNKQALGRNDRHDTKHERLNYYFIVANHPFQVRLHEILRRKAELQEDVLGTLD